NLGRIKCELGPWVAAAPCGEGPFFGRRTRRFSGLFAKAPATAALALDDLIVPTAEAVLGAGAKGCDRIQLNLTQAIGIGPGEPAQAIHRDDDFFPFAHAGAELMINAMWTLDRFSGANGATMVAPGSHHWDRRRRAGPEDLVVPEIARALPERLQQLIGYQIHRPNLGWVEGRDPIEWLRGEIGAVAAAGDNLTPKQTARIKALTAP
ncbi:MAG: phytanoyl-CoA dioxygenase, partial [Alphaproteobacteria bacterium]